MAEASQSSTSNPPACTPLEQEVLDEYARLLDNLNQVRSPPPPTTLLLRSQTHFQRSIQQHARSELNADPTQWMDISFRRKSTR